MEAFVRIMPICGFVLCVLLAIRLLRLQHKLYVYLRETHFEKWQELTTILGFGSGLANSYRGIPFLYGKDDLDDPEVRKQKLKVRKSIAWVFLTMLGTILTFIILVCLSLKT